MRRMRFLQMYVLLFVCVLNFVSCTDEMSKNYETPAWLKGSAWEVLEGRGNYKIFLEGAEKAGFKTILEGKSIATVMAPNDDAFKSYLRKQGKFSISDLTEAELTELIGIHILYYAYNMDKLVNFRPDYGDGATDDQKKNNAGLFYMFRSRSYSPPTQEIDTTGRYVTVYHNEAMLPVFSYEIFNTKNVDAKYNYEYFYPNSEWTGAQGFNVSNASVAEYEIITDNGYLYLIDRVIEPLNTIYDELKERGNYSTYLELYNRYEYYEYDEQLTIDFGTTGDSLYLHLHEIPLPSIAIEWATTNYRDIISNSAISYSTFAPSNDALDKLMDEYWAPGGYSSFSDVHSTAVNYLVENTVYATSIIFPEQITKGEVINYYDTTISFDVDAVPAENRAVCQNGVLYGLEELFMPASFTAVPGASFRNKAYSWYLYMLDGSSLIPALSSNESQFTLFVPSNTQMQASGCSIVDDVLYYRPDGDESLMGKNAMVEYVNLHTITGGRSIPASGTTVLHTNTAYNYMYINDGKIVSSNLFNEYFDNNVEYVPFYDLTEIKNGSEDWTNGRTYAYESGEMFQPQASTASMQYRLAITSDDTFPFYAFSDLLRRSGLASVATGGMSFLNSLRTLAFVPTNEAVVSAIANGEIPGMDSAGNITDQELLANYLKCYFVYTAENGITSYPYVGSGVSGSFASRASFIENYETVNVPLKIIDDGSKISVQLGRDIFEKGETPAIDVVPDYYYFPFSFPDGCVHYINGVL